MMIRWLKWKWHKWTRGCHCYWQKADGIWKCGKCDALFYPDGSVGPDN